MATKYYDISYLKVETDKNGDTDEHWVVIGRAFPSGKQDGTINLRFDAMPFDFNSDTKMALYPKEGK